MEHLRKKMRKIIKRLNNMNYPEWADRQLMIDLRNKIAKCYKNNDGSIFYVEPGFYKAFEALKNIYPDRIDDVLRKMDELTSSNKKVVYVSDPDDPLVIVEKAKYITIFDLTDSIGLLLEDKSRGSDYGD